MKIRTKEQRLESIGALRERERERESHSLNRLKAKVNRQGGITLVALVVTIVVLLILAGITIVYVFGDNGVFGKAKEAKDKTEQAKQDEQDYLGNVDNTINKYANGNGGGSGNGGTTNPDNPDTPTPPATEGPTVSESTSSNHTATTIDYTWEQIDKMAQAIAKSSSVTSETTEVTASIEGTTCTIGVGDIATVEYNGEARRVRILGFKHDDLVDTSAYGSGTTATKASISFEFYDFMTGDTYMQMNTSNTSTGGWASTKMRSDLNGSGSSIGGLGANLSNKEYIKQVKKKYIATRNDASSVTTCNDYLWLLAASEIVKDGFLSGYGYAITSEGSQYKYYQGVTEAWDASSTNRKKYNAAGSADWWWLRSPYRNATDSFCRVIGGGSSDANYTASGSGGVAPGFCI